jgi:dTDP-4-amino-4,6-dideoxygalactose transaminase
LDSQYLAPAGPYLQDLENWIANHWGMQGALALNSATSALQLAVRHLLETRHPRSSSTPPLILASSLTFIASISPALQMGCEVWLLDSEAASWTLDPVLLSHALIEAQAQNRQVLTVIPTDLYGQSCDLEAIHGLCEPLGIPVLVDAAESLGVKTTSTVRPWAQVTSFNGNKIVTSSAGGMLASDDPRLLHHARKLSMQAREPTPYYEHRELGYNVRMSHVLAGVALAQLETLQERVERRRQIFQRYQRNLEGLPGVGWMPEAGWNTATRWLSVMRLHPETTGIGPEDLRLRLQAHGIESRPVWKPLHQQPVLQGIRMFNNGVADQLFREGLCLPSGTAMTDEQVDEVSGILRDALAG